MRPCQVPDCERPATSGEDWTQPALGPIVGHQRGTALSLTVLDIAVTLRLCDEHATLLVESAWGPVNALLDGWGWTPLGER